MEALSLAEVAAEFKMNVVTTMHEDELAEIMSQAEKIKFEVMFSEEMREAGKGLVEKLIPDSDQDWAYNLIDSDDPDTLDLYVLDQAFQMAIQKAAESLIKRFLDNPEL